MFGNRIPTPPLGEWQTKNKTKQIVMPAKPKISKDQLFPDAVQRAKDIIENSNIEEVLGNNFPDFKHIPPPPQKEMVNGPAYYGGVDNPYEVIKVCEAWGLDKDAYLFNVAKYIARAGKKDPAKELEDLKKAVFYLERRIKLLSK